MLSYSDREWLRNRLEPSPFEKRMKRLQSHMEALEEALAWYAEQELQADEYGKWNVVRPGVRVARDALYAKEEK